MAKRRSAPRSSAVAARSRVKLAIHRRTLPNGATLLAVRTRSAPTLALTCSMELDQLNETADQAGVVHLVGDTLDEGTERWSGSELAEHVEGLGGHLRTSGSGATVQVAAADARKAARIAGEVMMRPTFPAPAVRRAKALTVADIKADQDDPKTVAAQRFRRLVYGGHPFAREAKGSVESVAKLTPAKLRTFHRNWFRPDQATIVAAGDVEPDKMLDLLSSTFRSWQGRSKEITDPPEPPRPSKPIADHIEQDRAQVQVFLGHLGIRRTDPDFYRLLVMDHVLGSGPGFTSRIARKLRDEQGLCYAVGAGITASAGRERGLFTAYIGTSPGQQEVAIDGFLREMRRIREEPPSESELSDVKAYLTGSFVWALERNANLASFLVRAERFQLGDDYVERFPDLIAVVSAEDVREAAARHLSTDRYYLVTLGKQ